MDLHKERPVGIVAAPFATVLLCAMAGISPAVAEEACEDGRARLAAASTINVRIDNDMFGGMGQDQGYSNGFLISSVSPNLVDYQDDPCLPASVQRLNRYLAWLQPDGYDEQNMTLGFGQVLFTPTDRKRTDLIMDDRPYAAALLFSTGYNARSGDHLRTSQIRFGIVGPSALGKQVQNGWHRIIGAEPFDGWKHQLRDEPVLQLIHERRQRWVRRVDGSGWGWDAVGHWGGSVGNFATYANTGAELRFGYRLPDDFGTAPLRPAGENTSPISAGASRFNGWAGHVFVGLDGRWVLHDITLDGNTFRSSHSVDKRPLVADVGYGLAITHGVWKFAFARYHRTREFDGQKSRPVYGSFTVSKRF
ncbi:lipid A deacylase LpxR family protein [Pectobacterium actinidiae]|uniref:lipid A deacylase LpxR family protein n=1 Tax=Pectobacterium actinidiae TaxID=1507808 RepID=UPI0037FC82D2